MSDVTQGQDVLESSIEEQQNLFNEAIDAPTLEKFENPKLPPDVVDDGKGQQKPPKQQEPDGPVPSGRFREELEARRRAERESNELRAQLAAYQVQQTRQQQQPQRPPVDMFDNPQGWLQQNMQPVLEAMRAENQQKLENLSADNAVRYYGEDKVTAARGALEQGMQRQDPQAWATYHRAMQSHDPYGVISRWHMDRETVAAVGGDLEGYVNKRIEAAMRDPNFQRQWMAAQRGNAQAAGSYVNQPVRQITQQAVPNVPSLSDIGAVGPDEQLSEPSDISLFRAAVTARRRS